MLSRTGFGDDPPLPHPLCQQRLTDAVVDLMGAGVQQVFTLEIDLCSAELLSETARVEKRSRPAGILFEQPLELSSKLFIASRLLVFALEFLECRHQRFWNVSPAIRAKASC